MGRVDTNATQYHQGLEFEDQFHHEVLETIDDAPPHDEGQDLYDPVLPPNYNEKIGSQVPTDDKPQAFPPPPPPHHHQEEHHHGMPQAFPPTPTDHDQDEANFPPQSSFPPQQITPFPQGVQIGHPAPGVVMSSPFLQLPNHQIPTQPWKTNLFDCMRDPQNAIITVFFPCVTFGQIAEIVDSGSTSCGTSGMVYGLIACCIAMPCIMSCAYRSKMRSRFGLIESPAPDWVVHCFCECCALCQEYRELQERGIDPSIGWLGNVAKQQQNQQFVMTTAPMQQRMM